MRYHLLVVIAGLLISGCTSMSSLDVSPTASSEQERIRVHYMELYRTMDRMPEPVPIIILRPVHSPTT
ncbi:hypothetical protein L4D09_25055 [Photobacterium makurazakiensis]|uniref:hypothetical protein n=1 Tax=Photobacterium makurazakiensis TaxID=2910234 RepID=UPI003D0D58AE